MGLCRLASGRTPAPSFRKVYDKGRSAGNRLLVLYYLAGDDDFRLGVSAGKRLGKAVVRNRLKRRVKEAFRRLRPSLVRGGQLVFIIRHGAVAATFLEILNAERDLLKRMELLQNG